MTDPVLEAVAAQAWAHVAATEPYYALRSGHPVERLPHRSYEEAQRDAAVGRSIRARLAAIEPAALGPDDRDTVALLNHLATEWSGAEESWWWHFPVAPYQSHELAQFGVQVLGGIVAADAPDVERYLSLAADLAAWIRTAHTKLVQQAERGWGVPHAALDGFSATIRGHRVAAAQWLHPGELSRLGAADRGRLCDGATKMLDSEVLPAFDALLDHLSGPAVDTATDGVGLARYPGGEAAYRRLVERYATYPISPEDVHETGRQQVAELNEQLADVRSEVGFDGTEQEYRLVLEADARFHAADPAAVEATYRRHIAAVEPVVDRWFRVLPRAPHDLRRLDRALEAGMSFGYYEPPTQQDPVGRYRYNGSGLDGRQQINAAPLILHELVPGHHFHLARQAEDSALGPLRGQVAPLVLGAFTEGWGEYAASLGFEMGVYTDPWDRYGAYLHQRFVAQRLVVDTGLNLHGWSLERAREYMTETTMESPAQIATETLRYSTDLPGQALGYRLGCLKFWQLRKRAESALGSAFDVRDFHELVLGAGALPFTAVEANVDRWIDGRGASS